jgi:hypothetical protein
MWLASRIVLLILLIFLAPLALRAAWWFARVEAAPNWSRADWSSARLLPEPAAHQEALVRVYTARVGRWRAIFAHHSWIVVKERGAARYTRFDKVGWGSPVRTNGWAADARWFGNEPILLAAADGPEAERLIPAIRDAVQVYEYRGHGDYRAWPGPNSNTFVASVLARAAPEFAAVLPPTALGKDWLPDGRYFSLTPSGTGVRLSLNGYLGLTLGWAEGIEVNFLGLVAGVDIRRPAIKIPSIGRIGMDPVT